VERVVDELRRRLRLGGDRVGGRDAQGVVRAEQRALALS